MKLKNYKFGLLIFFVHDVTDILLEFTKCNVYLKKRNGKVYAFHEYLSNIGFIAFAPNTECLPIENLERASKLVKELDLIADIIIVSFHGGAEGNGGPWHRTAGQHH